MGLIQFVVCFCIGLALEENLYIALCIICVILMTERLNITITDEQSEYIKQKGISPSKIIQKKIEEIRNNDRGNKQINVIQENNELTLTLKNYPKIVNAKKTDVGDYLPYYENPQGEIVQEPPIIIDKDYEDNEDIIAIKRKDNKNLCGVKIKNWEKHHDLTLVWMDLIGDPGILLDTPEA